MTLHDRLQEIFRTVFADDALVVTDETTADDVPGWDSVAHINLMFAIEQDFDIQFTGNELAEMATVGELVAYLEARSMK